MTALKAAKRLPYQKAYKFLVIKHSNVILMNKFSTVFLD